ncbi:MAG TPA: Gfo/Idh/MocA family oxidoreductase [Tepidisphaeraceae bacterium]|jgi:predicted dehydrogenase
MTRVAFLGTGGIARTHAKNLTACGATIVAACGRTPEKAGAFLSAVAGREDAARGEAFGAHDFDRMLTVARPDALYVCLPPDAHTGQAEAAAERGVHLFLEKPIALTIERAASIVSAVERAGVRSQVGYHLRFAPTIRRLRAMLDSGDAGRPTLLQARWFCNALHSPWWRDVRRSGGQAFEQAIHLYDLALHLLGDAEAVSAVGGNLCHTGADDGADAYTGDDTSVATVRCAGGAAASISASNCAIPTRWSWETRLVCSKLTAEVTSAADATFTPYDGTSEQYNARATRPADEVFHDPSDPYRAINADFLTAIGTGSATLAPAREGLRGVRLMTAVTTSMHAGGRQEIVAG